MDLNDIRTIETIALFFLFIGLVFLVYRKKDKQLYDDAANIPFIGDDTSNLITKNQKKGENHE